MYWIDYHKLSYDAACATQVNFATTLSTVELLTTKHTDVDGGVGADAPGRK